MTSWVKVVKEHCLTAVDNVEKVTRHSKIFLVSQYTASTATAPISRTLNSYVHVCIYQSISHYKACNLHLFNKLEIHYLKKKKKRFSKEFQEKTMNTQKWLELSMLTKCFIFPLLKIKGDYSISHELACHWTGICFPKSGYSSHTFHLPHPTQPLLSPHLTRLIKCQLAIASRKKHQVLLVIHSTAILPTCRCTLLSLR